MSELCPFNEINIRLYAGRINQEETYYVLDSENEEPKPPIELSIQKKLDPY